MATMIRDRGALQRSFFTGFYFVPVSITAKKASEKGLIQTFISFATLKAFW
jgi:hypothetical protein